MPKRTEPILLPSVISDESHEAHNTSSEFYDLEHDDESSHNSTAIEDIKMFMAADDQSTAPVLHEALDQLQAELIDDTAAQVTTARGNERLTATLTDTMHEDTQVRRYALPVTLVAYGGSVPSSFIRHPLSRQSNGSRIAMCLFGSIEAMRWGHHRRQ